ncbi:hypothetical protein HNY73_011121 [Argiope bruennichi]|uniref:Uncharacterized protein n=1 Tax=Argiope bruennichi TaxID=94029 RepID=A0A8T0F9D2_ARGBR|nr:hypothetical protein HNY73_011121 [Argiope bruennichi]
MHCSLFYSDHLTGIRNKTDEFCLKNLHKIVFRSNNSSYIWTVKNEKGRKKFNIQRLKRWVHFTCLNKIGANLQKEEADPSNSIPQHNGLTAENEIQKEGKKESQINELDAVVAVIIWKEQRYVVLLLGNARKVDNMDCMYKILQCLCLHF